MGERKSGNGWKIAVFILVAIFLIQSATNAQKSNKINQLNSQLSAAQTSSQAANSTPTTNTPVLTTPNSAQPANAKLSWLCNSSLNAGLGNIPLNLLCTPNYGGGTNDLSCTGNITANLTSSTYASAPINMTCSEE
jgi:hypothetical protein